MNERLFGFNSEKLKLATPSTSTLTAEMEQTFGHNGFHTSFDFSVTTEVR